uniref:Cytochrome b561 family member D1 n=1 Tax=Vombatus ursinus TaxID=29139 RepID=A0A4X2LCW2_VOMUR
MQPPAVSFLGTLCSWPWRSACAWLKPSYSSLLTTHPSSSAHERCGSDYTGGRP